MRREQTSSSVRVSIAEAARVRQWCLNRGIKQEDVAKQIGIPLSTLRHALSGTGTLKPETHAKLIEHIKP